LCGRLVPRIPRVAVVGLAPARRMWLGRSESREAVHVRGSTVGVTTQGVEVAVRMQGEPADVGKENRADAPVRLDREDVVASRAVQSAVRVLDQLAVQRTRLA